MSDDEKFALDWLNLPSTASASSLWDSLHDGQVVCIQSNLLGRSAALSCEVEHLRTFHHLGEGFRFILHLEGVQSARVLRYAVWPGGCPELAGLFHDEQQRLAAEYQAKWREESASWNEFESAVSGENENVFDISDASLATSPNGPMALRLRGHLNDESFHEVFLRFETLKIAGSDGSQFGVEEFQRLGGAYWEAFSKRAKPTM